MHTLGLYLKRTGPTVVYLAIESYIEQAKRKKAVITQTKTKKT